MLATPTSARACARALWPRLLEITSVEPAPSLSPPSSGRRRTRPSRRRLPRRPSPSRRCRPARRRPPSSHTARSGRRAPGFCFSAHTRSKPTPHTHARGVSSPTHVSSTSLRRHKARGRDVVTHHFVTSRTTRPYTKRTLPCGSRGATEPMSPAPCSTSVATSRFVLQREHGERGGRVALTDLFGNAGRRGSVQRERGDGAGDLFFSHDRSR